jgi:CRISPR/Cas system-associated exonuclease Cas4 (RecB family)
MRPWSYSALTLYESCPQAYKLRYVDRIKSPGSEAMDRGNEIHQGLEDFLNRIGPLPTEAEGLTDYYRALQAEDPTIEEEWGYTQDWAPVPWNHKDIWCRMKLDVYVPGEPCKIVDHKTGKHYQIKAIDQGQLYAIGASIQSPEAETFDVQFAYVDQDMFKAKSYKRAHVERFKEKFTRRATILGNDTEFKPKPHKITCKFCHLKEHCSFNMENSV